MERGQKKQKKKEKKGVILEDQAANACMSLSRAFRHKKMTTAAKMLTNSGGNPFHPLHIIFVRMAASTALGFAYTWYRSVPDAPLGRRSIRRLLLLRGLTGFVGLWGTYCEFFFSSLFGPLFVVRLSRVVPLFPHPPGGGGAEAK